MWIVGKPNGPSGPFYSVVSDRGEVVAMQIPSQAHVERIAKIPNFAQVEHRQGRYLLVVNGLIVAMEGDPIRDPNIDGARWSKASLQQAANIINGDFPWPV